jgi:FkbM family methyltransferase
MNTVKRALDRIHRDTSRALGMDALTGQRIESRNDLVRLGSQYGGWIVPASVLQPDSICYCAGVGEDISFDLALMKRFGCDVHAFDPTPRAIEFVRRTAADVPGFHFHPVGLWERDESLRFYAPSNPDHVSHSVMNLQQTDSYFEAPCRSLPSLMKELGHSRVDLLKLDIEGAEHEVIESMLEDGIRPAVLCVEFDQPVNVRALRTTLGTLDGAGYTLAGADGWNYTFVRGTDG